ncbi:MAG TPA: cysteine desulfurase family protein [Lactovum miscens]|uniref:cysteine desulfurase family protein n=1 Tax=Lactovum miscens TaxID=190387 RepID=UPI002EDB420C
MIYLDNAATTSILPQVIEAMTLHMAENYGNPSSIHGIGRIASKSLRESRQTIAGILGVPAISITFTADATEANNTAIISYAIANIERGKHIITTSIEHPSVLEAMRYLEERFGFEVTTVTPDPDGELSAKKILSSIRSDTILVSVMMANNETGQILPVKEIGQALKDKNIAFHVDAVQAMGKIPVLPLEIGADFLTASAHKFHGPKGVGLLYHSDKYKFDNFMHGGDQENKRRAGTENTTSIVGMAKALEIAQANWKVNYKKVQQLHERLLSNLNGLNFYQNQFGTVNMPHVLNLGFSGLRNDLLLTKLDLAGIAVSTGSACTAGAVEPSHVLESVYGGNSEKLQENIRVSLSEINTLQEIDQFTDILKGFL